MLLSNIAKFFALCGVLAFQVFNKFALGATTCTNSYTVKSGDYCWLIANNNGVTVNDITTCTNAVGFLGGRKLDNTNCYIYPNDKLCLACSTTAPVPAPSPVANSVSLCDFSAATSGSAASNYCKGIQGTTMNTYLNFNWFSVQSGFLTANPRDNGASFYLVFGGCTDGRSFSSIAVDVMAPSASTSLVVDIGVSQTGCISKSSTIYSAAYSVSQGSTYQTIQVPISIFKNMDLSKMFTMGFTAGTGKELRVKNIRMLGTSAPNPPPSNPVPVSTPVAAPVVVTASSFVTRSQSTLYEWVNGVRRIFKFVSFNAPDLIGRNDQGQDAYLDPWEQEDLIITAKQMNARAVRTYTLRIRKQDEIWNGYGTTKAVQGSRSYGETQFVHLDRALDYAYKHGIRVIIPFIDNWSWYGGVDDFAAFRGLQHNDFFYDANLRADFKALINKVLTRVNTVNNRVYKDDPTILAWQLGNELCLNPNRNSVPVSWSAEMADYIRSIDANHLIMDGTWDNNANYAGGDWSCDSAGCLKNVKNLDILSAHYYGSGPYATLMAKCESNAYNAGKAFMVDEYGLSTVSEINSISNAMTTSTKTSGILIWSIRSQAVKGGAVIHSEGNDAYSYHWPGYTGGPLCGGFTQDNFAIVTNLKATSFTVSDATGIARPSNFPPCTHIPKIVTAIVASTMNSPFSGCVQVLSHSNFAGGNYRRVDITIRQATGSWTNVLQMSFDGVNFKTVGNADMTVQEGKVLFSHYVPATSNSGSTTILYYRVMGILSDNQNSTPSTVAKVSFLGIDSSFVNYIVNSPNGVGPSTGAPTCT